jgi:phosphatidylglycerophosphatase A
VALLPLFVLPEDAYPWLVLGGAALATLACAPLARSLGVAEKGDQGDPGWFVLDEAAGLWVAAFATSRPGPAYLILAFLLFRVFDMLKPPPLRWIEKAGRGWGVVLDDLLAGMYALVLTMILASVLTVE